MSSRVRWCNKCRVAEAHPEDSWCQWCSSLERLGDLSRTRFAAPAFRFFASEIVFQALRQAQGVITLDRRSQGALESARRLAERHSTEGRPSVEDRAGRNPPGVTPKKEAKPNEDQEARGGGVKLEENQDERREESPDYGRDSESSSHVPGRDDQQRRSSGSKRPPEPPYPPSNWEEGQVKKRRSKSRGRRGGAKHQGKYRGLEDPSKVFHNKLKIDPIPLGDRRR